MATQEIMERRRQFILINHYYMTNKEMADELGMNPPALIHMCNELGVTGITLKERVIEYIKDHPDYSQQRVMDKFDISTETIHNYMKECGIQLINVREAKNEEKSAKGISSWSQEAKEYVSSISAWKDPDKPRIKRPKW